MERQVQFSFLKLFNTIKGVYKPAKEFEDDYLEQRADKITKTKYNEFFKWCDEVGITHPKVKYPVLFGKGKSKYPGMLATDDIG